MNYKFKFGFFAFFLIFNLVGCQNGSEPAKPADNIATKPVAKNEIEGIEGNTKLKVEENKVIKEGSSPQIKLPEGRNSKIGLNPKSEGLKINVIKNFSYWPEIKVLSSPLPVKSNIPFPEPIKINQDGSLDQIASTQQPLVGSVEAMWSPGETITVGFIKKRKFVEHNAYVGPGDYLFFSQALMDRIKKIAKEWETIANIKFDFISDSRNAEIRIGITDEDRHCVTSTTYYGRGALSIGKDDWTVNLRGITDEISDSELRPEILNVFGAVLGFTAEIKSPSSEILWNKDFIYNYFSNKCGDLDRDMLVNYFIDRWPKAHTNYSAFDKYSIMCPEIPSSFTLDGFSTPKNTEFSPTDIQYAGLYYPFPPNQTDQVGILRTGDDCDEIDFKVQFNVVPSDVVEFVLYPGRNHKNQVIDWWKQISIPINVKIGPIEGLGFSKLEMSGGQSAVSQILFSSLNTNAGMGFAKAKVLGVHTDLNFKWNVMPALRGGCRVILTWREDSCG